MLSTYRFIKSALSTGYAYIDLDGCLLRRMRVPAHVDPKDALSWWTDNLCVTPIVKRRLALVYLLHMCGVELFIWTNRAHTHIDVTHKALGKHMTLFKFSYFLGGRKQLINRLGPCMDDQAKYIGKTYHDLLVKQL
jgi:hypothetical protein